MSTLTVKDLKAKFGANPQEASLFLLLLSKLEPGDELISSCIKVTKLEDDKFQLAVDESLVDSLVNDLSESSVDPLAALIGSSSD